METFLRKFEGWLIDRGIASAHNYSIRLKKVIGEWNKSSSSELVPFEEKMIPVVFSSRTSEEVIDNVVFRLHKFNDNAFLRNEYGKGYHDDIVTAINRFGEFAISCSAQATPSPEERMTEISARADAPVSDGLANLQRDKTFFQEQEFDIRELLDAIVKRTRTRDSNFWPARKFSGILPEKGKWIEPFVNSLIVMTECGIHKLKDVTSFKVKDDILYVKPEIYKDNPQLTKSKAKNLAQISADGYVKAYSYHADGSVHPFRVSYDASGSPISSISFEHTPAISLIISKGDYPELDNLIADRRTDVARLQKEMGDVLSHMTCVLMQKDQNVLKKDAW